MKNIVLIDGIPGSGKSTFARFLANQFERNGYICRLFHETTFDHPIIRAASEEDYSLFLEGYYNRWLDFLSSLPEDEIVVMESAFFQCPIVHLLHKDVDRNLIKPLIMKVSNLLRNENSSLIYFYQQNVSLAINKMIESRGGKEYLERKHNEYQNEPYFLNRQEEGPESHISFFHEYADLVNEIVKEINIPAEIIENSAADYSSYEKDILERYNLKHVPDPILDPAQIQNYTGAYHNKEMNLTISVELINGDLWIFDNKRLNPKNKEKFYLDDISVLVSFIVNHNRVTGMVITEKDIFANRNDEGTHFKKIT